MQRDQEDGAFTFEILHGRLYMYNDNSVLYYNPNRGKNLGQHDARSFVNGLGQLALKSKYLKSAESPMVGEMICWQGYAPTRVFDVSIYN
jgi:hypothetical protein